MARYTAAYIIAFHLGWDIKDVSDARYQSTRYTNPSIYVIGEDYYAAPSNNIPPKTMKGDWKEIATYYDRKIFELKMEKQDE